MPIGLELAEDWATLPLALPLADDYADHSSAIEGQRNGSPFYLFCVGQRGMAVHGPADDRAVTAAGTGRFARSLEYLPRFLSGDPVGRLSFRPLLNQVARASHSIRSSCMPPAISAHALAGRYPLVMNRS